MTKASSPALGVPHPGADPVPAGGRAGERVPLEEADGGLLLFDSGLGSPEAHAALEAGFAGSAAASTRCGASSSPTATWTTTAARASCRSATAAAARRCTRTPPTPRRSPRAGWRWRERRRSTARTSPGSACPRRVLARARGRAGLRPRAPRARRRARIGEGERGPHAPPRARGAPHAGPHARACSASTTARAAALLRRPPAQKISPNPLIELGPNGEEGSFRPLVAYLESVARMRALDLDLVLPGHGPPFSDHRAVIDRLVGFYGKRQEQIRALLARGSATAYELARRSSRGAARRGVPHDLRDGREPRGAGGARRGRPRRDDAGLAGTGLPRFELDPQRTARQCIEQSPCSSPPPPDAWISLAHAHRDGDRPRHRQHRLHRHPRGQAARRRSSARALGLALALGTRICCCFAITWIMGLTRPLFSSSGRASPGATSSCSAAASSSSPRPPRDPRQARGRARRGESAPRRAAGLLGVIVQIGCSTSSSRSTR